MAHSEIEEIATMFVALCLQELVRLGHVSKAQVDHQWYVKANAEKLAARGLVGTVTLDIDDHVVMYLRPDLTIEGLMNVVAHEAVHVAQVCRGDLVPMFDDHQLWKGQRHQLLAGEDPEYFSAQPWEKEAQDLQPILLSHLRSVLAK